MHAARPGRRGAGAGARGLLCTAEPCCCCGLKTSLLVVSALGPRCGGLPGSPQITELGTSEWEPWTFPGLSARHPHKAPSSGVSPGSLL